MGEGEGVEGPGNEPIGNKPFGPLDKVRRVAHRLGREDASVDPAEGVVVRRRGDKLLFLTNTAIGRIVAQIELERGVLIERIGAIARGELKAAIVVSSRTIPEAQRGIERAAIGVVELKSGSIWAAFVKRSCARAQFDRL